MSDYTKSPSHEYTSWGIKSLGTKEEKIDLLKKAIELVFDKTAREYFKDKEYTRTDIKNRSIDQ